MPRGGSFNDPPPPSYASYVVEEKAEDNNHSLGFCFISDYNIYRVTSAFVLINVSLSSVLGVPEQGRRPSGKRYGVRGFPTGG